MAAAVNPSADETARKTVALIFQRLSAEGQVHVAASLATSEATVSRLKEITPQFVAMLARLGLQVLPADVQAYDAKTIDALLVLARQRLAQIGGAAELAAAPSE